jgi:DNA-binding transcriptional LysR family regulator
LRRVAGELTGVQGGTLRVGATPSLATILVPAAVTASHARYPGPVLGLVEADAEDLVGRIEANELDLALVILPVR